MDGARTSGGRGGEQVLLAAAQSGDEQAYVGLTSPHRRALHIHCCRMVGSLHDADDAPQEILRAATRSPGSPASPQDTELFEQLGAPLVLTTR